MKLFLTHKAVAVEAFPVKAPTKDVEVIDTIPAIVLTVERAAIAVVPNVNMYLLMH
jgi:hypothetical protein